MDKGLSSWRCRLRSRCSWGADNHHASGCGQKEIILSYHSVAEQKARKRSIETLWYLECSDQEDNPVSFFLLKDNSKRKTTYQTIKVLWIYFSDYRPQNSIICCRTTNLLPWARVYNYTNNYHNSILHDNQNHPK